MGECGPQASSMALGTPLHYSLHSPPFFNAPSQALQLAQHGFLVKSTPHNVPIPVHHWLELKPRPRSPRWVAGVTQPPYCRAGLT